MSKLVFVNRRNETETTTTWTNTHLKDSIASKLVVDAMLDVYVEAATKDEFERLGSFIQSSEISRCFWNISKFICYEQFAY